MCVCAYVSLIRVREAENGFSVQGGPRSTKGEKVKIMKSYLHLHIHGGGGGENGIDKG